MPFLEGIVYGLVLMLIIGPSFFYLIRVSIKKGFIRAVAFACGIMVSDLLVIAAIFLGLSKFLEQESYQTIASFIAGVVIFILGIRNLTAARHAPPEVEDDLDDETKAPNGGQAMLSRIGLFGFFLKGIAINGMNPFTVVLWITVLATVTARNDYTTADFTLFLGGLITVIMTADFLKAYLAHKLSNILTPNTLHRIDKVLGVIFLLLSIRFFYFYL